MEFFPRVCARFPSYVITNPRVIQYVHHDDNYSIRVWRKPDCLDQMRRVEAAAVAHAGLDAATTERIVAARLLRDMTHMLQTAIRLGDRGVVRLVSRELAKRQRLGRRWRLAVNLGKVLGWFPEGLISWPRLAQSG